MLLDIANSEKRRRIYTKLEKNKGLPERKAGGTGTPDQSQ
jgi:hypothetical protein